MKKIWIRCLVTTVLFPGIITAQFMKDYRPNGSPVVSGTANLVSVVEVAAAAPGNRMINTIQENPNTNTRDVWVTATDATGNLIFSRRYGMAGTDESAAALVRCPNGDFIYTATTTLGGIQSAWLFRRGILNWSIRYVAPNSSLKPYCIKKTNENAEHYIIAATTNTDKSLVVYKINMGGGLVWNRRYADAVPPSGLADIPKSMIINRDTIIIAGNRTTLELTGAPKRDLFVIGINQATGAVNHPYRVIDNSNRDEKDPFINVGMNNEYVLTYQCVSTIGGVNTGRIAFTRLNYLLNLVTGTSSLLWENNTLNSFGHSIYKGLTPGAVTYDIGGGTYTGNFNNPLFVTITNVGMPVAGTYRRLWTTLNLNSTFMMQGAANLANRYGHHNFKQLAGQNSMSLLKNNALAAPCNANQVINHQYVQTSTVQRIYSATPLLTQVSYPVPDFIVNGTIINCNSTLINNF